MNQADSPVYYYLGVLADMVIVNILCLICTIPIVTAGAAWAASYKVMQDLIMGQEGRVLNRFFAAFRDNFRQASVVYICLCAALFGLVCQSILVVTYFSGTVVMVLLGITLILGICLFILASHARTLLVRYRNSLREHWHNALLLLITHPVRSLLIVAARLMPILLWNYAPDIFYRTMILWFFVGISAGDYLESLLMRNVLLSLEDAAEHVC